MTIVANRVLAATQATCARQLTGLWFSLGAGPGARAEPRPDAHKAGQV